MDSKSAALFLAINLVLFAVTSGSSTPCPPSSPTPKPISRPNNPIPPSTCPRDALKLGACANLLNGAVGAVVGNPPDVPCCSLLRGLVDLEVALCLCTAIKANVLGINLNVPIALSLLVDTCGKKLPRDFQCA